MTRDPSFPTGREIADVLQAQHDERLRHLLDGQVPDWCDRAVKTGNPGVELDDWQRDLVAAYREVLRRREAQPAPVAILQDRVGSDRRSLDAYQPDFEEVIE